MIEKEYQYCGFYTLTDFISRIRAVVEDQLIGVESKCLSFKP